MPSGRRNQLMLRYALFTVLLSNKCCTWKTSSRHSAKTKSVHADVPLPNQVPPPLALGFEVSGKLFRRVAGGGDGAADRQPLLDRLVPHHFLGDGKEFSHNWRRCAARHEHALPRSAHHPGITQFVQRRNRWQLRHALRGG